MGTRSSTCASWQSFPLTRRGEFPNVPEPQADIWLYDRVARPFRGLPPNTDVLPQFCCASHRSQRRASCYLHSASSGHTACPGGSDLSPICSYRVPAQVEKHESFKLSDEGRSQRFTGGQAAPNALQPAMTKLRVTSAILGHSAMAGSSLAGSDTRSGGHQSASIFYLPEMYRTDCIALSSVLAGENVLYEVAIPQIVGILTDGNSSAYEVVSGKSLLGDIRNKSNFGLGKGAGDSAWLHTDNISRHKKLILQWWSELVCSI
jgi:hypothetical protein